MAGLLLFALAALLNWCLPHPPLTLGLWWQNLLGFVPDLVNPWFLSPVLVVLGLVGALVALRSGESPGRRLLAGQILVWSLLLGIVWGAQGSEGNVALGASRYAVVWLPWLAAGMALLLDRLSQKWVRYGLLSLLLVSCLPQLPMMTRTSNLQLEHNFYVQALALLPEGSTLVLPAAPPENPEFTPEAAPLALLALARREVRWLSLEEALEQEKLPADSFLLVGLYRVESQLDELGQMYHLEPVIRRGLRCVPDLVTDTIAADGQEVTVGLYRLGR